MLAYRLFFWLADCAVFVCERQRQHWLWRGVCAQKNQVIYNGVDTEEFHDRLDPGERARLRSTLGFAAADYVLGISARLSPEKNHVQLVEAVARLRAMDIPACALMVGDGEMRQTIEARARELDVADYIVITGFQQDVRPFVGACDAMVLCSHTEAFSLSGIEAMAMGKPLVHSEVGGAAEMIRPGENGFLFPVGDTPALVDSLERLAAPLVRERLGNKARASVESLFSETNMVDRYEKLMLDLCRSRPASSAVAFP